MIQGTIGLPIINYIKNVSALIWHEVVEDENEAYLCEVRPLRKRGQVIHPYRMSSALHLAKHL